MIFHGVANGHQDTKLKYEDGLIAGLPANYSPASFDRKNLVLSIAGKKMILPDVFLSILLEDISADPFDGPRTYKTIPCDFSFTASWYHGDLGGDLPPYIVVTAAPRNTDTHFEILVDMDTLSVIQADVVIKNLGSIPIKVIDRRQDESKEMDNKPEQTTPRKPSD